MVCAKSMKLAADTVRVLSADGVQKAKSGHPGMPMGAAEVAFTLWFNHMKHNPKNPEWLGRDRFVLSAGHASMLLYSLFHLFGYGLTMDDLKEFRQWGSRTPGHPEFGHTRGVEVTTGPLGTGFASGVGMAIASRHFAAITGLDAAGLMNNKIYIVCGDGCMMEGISHETASLAGHLKLDNIVLFYDDNKISIEGSTQGTFTEDVGKRYDAYGWRVLRIANANDVEEVDKILAQARISDGRPTMVICTSVIGFGSPTKAGKASSHGEPLGEEDLAGLKKNLNFPADSFYIPQEVRDMLAKRCAELEAEAAAWDAKFQKFIESNPEKAQLISDLLSKKVPADIEKLLIEAIPADKPAATRASGGAILQKLAAAIPSMMGGSADLAPSTKTEIKDGGWFSAENPSGRNIHFGVREMAMGCIVNGLALFGAFIPFCSTFFVFSDFMKPTIRLACLQKIHTIYVFTHDSFYVGEDGPTHEPIEQLTMLRTIPGMTVIRPADCNETIRAWTCAIKSETPVALILTRQNVDQLPAEVVPKMDVSKGAYIVSCEEGFEYELIAAGSEVSLALDTAKILREQGKKVRVVSMPSMELFLAQSKEYQEKIIPASCTKRVTIEAGSTLGWRQFAGDKGLTIGLDHFGASAPYKVLAEKFGFTPQAVADKINAFFA